MTEKTEYEIEDGVILDDNAAPEVEVIDDTPEVDKNRTLMTTPPADVTEKELSQYTDEKLKSRLAHMGKGYHEERRAKELAQREREEAVRVAQAVVEENKRLQGSLATNQTALLDHAKHSVATEIETAKRDYKQAYEAGDSEALLQAQENLTAAKIRADKIQNFRPTAPQPLQNVVQTQQITPPSPGVDAKTQEWLSQNKWFDDNRKMRAYALSVHEDLVESGVPVSSDEYYDAIDADVRKRFPESFAEESAGAKPSQRSKSNVVAPASRSTAPKKIVLTQTQVNIAKRLGVPLELYARKVAEQLRT